MARERTPLSPALHLLRLIAAALSMLLSAQAFASFPLTEGYYITVHGGGEQLGPFQTPAAACDPWFAASSLARDWPKTTQYVSLGYSATLGGANGSCRAGKNGQTYASSPLSKANGCPPGSKVVNGVCVCDAGLNEQVNGGVYSCTPPEDSVCENAGAIWNSTLNDDTSGRVPGEYSTFADGAVACHDAGKTDGSGCKHWFTANLGFKDGDGKPWVNGTSIALTKKDDPRAGGDLSCSLKDPPNPEDPPKAEQKEDDKKDCYEGTVNGKDVCIKVWTGETEGVDFGITKGPDGTTTNTTNEIKCNGDQCTIKETNTIKDADGNTIKQTTSTTPGVSRGAYCAKNPQSSVCFPSQDQSGESKGQGGSGGGGGGKGNDPGELDGSYTEIGAPKLYEKKYENGIKGVWDKHAAEFKNTPISGLAAKLFPNYGDGGSAPTYIIDLNLGGKWNLGSYDLNFDSRVWLALKAFTILCALALARKLVFGG